MAFSIPEYDVNSQPEEVNPQQYQAYSQPEEEDSQPYEVNSQPEEVNSQYIRGEFTTRGGKFTTV
jgi:hypothetical protein